MRYAWNSAKAHSNVEKHGVPFDAVEAFEWDSALVRATLSHDTGEPRLAALGFIDKRLHALVYSVERASVRVISLRKANQRERAGYDKAQDGN